MYLTACASTGGSETRRYTCTGGSETRPCCTGRGGFSLFEMMTALTVVGILAALALPRLDVDSYKVNSAVRSITSSLTYAERLAVSLQHDVRVAFDSAGSRLRVHEDLNNDGVMDAGERVTYSVMEPGVVFGRGAAPAFSFGGATFNFTRTQGGLPVVVFRRDGSASESGGFYIVASRAAASSNAHGVRAGEIIRGSGRVIWHSYATGAWTRGN